MGPVERIKHAIFNLDLNQLLSSTLTAVLAVSTEDMLQVLFTTITVMTSILAAYNTHKRNKVERALKNVELQDKQLELDYKRSKYLKEMAEGE